MFYKSNFRYEKIYYDKKKSLKFNKYFRNLGQKNHFRRESRKIRNRRGHSRNVFLHETQNYGHHFGRFVQQRFGNSASL